MEKNNINQQIKQELNDKFDFDYSPTFPLNETDIVSIAFLKKEILFYSELNGYFDHEQTLFNNTDNVRFFGLTDTWGNPTYQANLRIHDYKTPDDFIFQMGTKSGKDEIYFAKVAPQKTLTETYKSVMDRVNLDKLELLGQNEQIRIPFIQFNIEQEYKEVENLKILNKGFETYQIGKAVQLIDFNLNESGITLKSTSEFSITESISQEEPKKTHF